MAKMISSYDISNELVYSLKKTKKNKQKQKKMAPTQRDVTFRLLSDSQQENKLIIPTLLSKYMWHWPETNMTDTSLDKRSKSIFFSKSKLHFCQVCKLSSVMFFLNSIFIQKYSDFPWHSLKPWEESGVFLIICSYQDGFWKKRETLMAHKRSCRVSSC